MRPANPSAILSDRVDLATDTHAGARIPPAASRRAVFPAAFGPVEVAAFPYRPFPPAFGNKLWK